MCSLEQDYQFDTKFVDLEASIDASVEKPTLLNTKWGVKVTKGQIWGGSRSLNYLYDAY